MTRRKHSSGRIRAVASSGIAASGIASFRRAAFACAAVLAVAACEAEPAPKVHGEPQQVQGAATSAAEARPAAPTSEQANPSRVQEAKYDEGSGKGLPSERSEGAPAPNAPSGETKPVATGAAPTASAEASPAGATKGKPTQGAVVSEESFSVWLQAESPVAAGGAAAVEAVLVAKAPYHCNAEYPHKFKLDAPPAGLTYPAEVVKGMVVTAERGVLRIPVQAQSAGPAKVSGTLSFSVCTDERCLVEKRDLALNLDVR